MIIETCPYRLAKLLPLLAEFDQGMISYEKATHRMRRLHALILDHVAITKSAALEDVEIFRAQPQVSALVPVTIFLVQTHTPPRAAARITDVQRRIRVALAIAAGTLTRQQICAKFSVTPRFIDYTRREMRTKAGQRRIFDATGPGRTGILTSEHIAVLNEIFRSNTDGHLTAAKAKTLLCRRFPELATVSISTIRRAAKLHCRQRWRRSDVRPPPVRTRDHQEKKTEFARIKLGLDRLGASFIYIDEYSMYASDIKPYAWKTQGEQGALIVPHRGKALKMIAAVSESKLVHLQVLEDKVKAEHFVAFMEELAAIAEVDPSIDNRTLIYFADGAPIHTAKVVHEHVRKAGLRMLINVAYTPEFNPAEAFIAAHKVCIRRRLATHR